MSKKYRLTLMALSLAVLTAIGYCINKNFAFILGEFWFTAGFLLLILISLIDQPHFSKDSNVFVNAVTAGVSLLLIDKADRNLIFWMFLSVVLYLTTSSYAILWLRRKTLREENRIVQVISRVNRQIGRPEAIFSAFFLWGAAMQYTIYTNKFNYLLSFWVIFTVLNIPALARAIELLTQRGDRKGSENTLGRIFGVQSKNTFLVKLDEKRPVSTLFDFVEFKYSVDNRVRKGLLFDIYLLNEQQWVKVLSNREIESIFGKQNVFTDHQADTVYRIEATPDNDYLKRFIGIVTENSTIGKVRFIYNSRMPILEGNLLQVSVNDTDVLY